MESKPFPQIDGGMVQRKKFIELVSRWVKNPSIFQLNPDVIHFAKVALNRLAFDTVKIQQPAQRPRDNGAHEIALASVKNAFAELFCKFDKFFVSHSLSFQYRQEAGRGVTPGFCQMVSRVATGWTLRDHLSAL